MATSIAEQDRSSIWHPFAQMKTASPIPIVKGKGVYLYGEDGKKYIDGISSWCVNLHGHAHPYIVEKISSQAEILEHACFADFTHAPAVNLASRLLSCLPGKMSKIFYSDNGATSVEVALKIALQYWYNQNSSKKKIVCFKNSYHGETFGTMSASGKNAINRPFWSHLFEVESIDVPVKGKEEQSIQQLKNILSKGDVACFIFEPLILGFGGMILYEKEILDALLEICKNSDVLTIADEVMTGFGRTGSLFACDQLRQHPDFICLSKGLTGGFLPLGATACTERIFNAFLGDDLKCAFLHGHSYTANPIACASALASLDLLLEKNCTLQREKIASCHKSFCEQWRSHPKLKRCVSLGTILVLEYQSNDGSYFDPMRNRLYRYFLDNGILLRPLGNVVYVMPPYCITEEELQLIYKKIIL